MDTNFMQNLQDALTVTIIGMASVLIFLTVLIFAMHLMEKLMVYINKIFPPEIKEEPSKKDKKQSTDEDIAVAIAAVVAHQSRT